ncbi:hypothetical protein [Mangrovibacterium marinum]|uniref:Uncharacterized protein n=1 Tax=Mangrovibacterium marinum TaxID=1639118 RepID=A0A2T5C2F0_9BACT|nr:hypothetical protein [Mangrovibacterium marinum]PTN08906.1 hypothetical protein C8N47_1063 [Mangrovibacterium marinum]
MSFATGHLAELLSRFREHKVQLKWQKHGRNEAQEKIFLSSQLKSSYQEGNEEDQNRIIEQIRADEKHQARLERRMLILSIVLFILAFGWFARNLI